MSKRKFAALVVAALAAGMLLALPANAMATSKKTKIVVTSYVTVDNTDPSVTATNPVVTAKPYYWTGSTWKAISLPVTLYRQSNLTGLYSKVTSIKGSAVKFTLSSPAQYKVQWAGNSYYAKSYASTKRYDKVVSDFSVNLALGSSDATYTTLILTTNAQWNANATTAKPYIDYYGEFWTGDPMSDLTADYGVDFEVSQTLSGPGTYVSTVTLRNQDLLSFLEVHRYLSFSFDNPFIKGSYPTPEFLPMVF